MKRNTEKKNLSVRPLTDQLEGGGLLYTDSRSKETNEKRVKKEIENYRKKILCRVQILSQTR
jgi:hypothetical protein